MKRDSDRTRTPTRGKPFAPKFFLALIQTDPADARRVLREVLVNTRSIPEAARALGIAEGTLRGLREDGWASNVKVRGRGRPKTVAP